MPAQPFDFDFRIRAPAPPLNRFAESLWYARGTVPYRSERIAPTGSTVAVFVLGDPIRQTPRNGEGEALLATRGFLIGPHVGPVINAPTGETFAMGIVGTPVGCRALFGCAPASLRGKVVDLETAWPAATALRQAVLDATDPIAKLDALEAHLQRAPRAVVAGHRRGERAVALIEADPTRPIADIAADLGISHGHLDREMRRIVGLTPRVFARLLRLRRLLESIDVQASVDWAGLAATWGWFDQGHLIRDFKRHTGVTPTTYLAAQRATDLSVSSTNAAGFVPEGTRADETM